MGVVSILLLFFPFLFLSVRVGLEAEAVDVEAVDVEWSGRDNGDESSKVWSSSLHWHPDVNLSTAISDNDERARLSI
jgi:hypothetical protein